MKSVKQYLGDGKLNVSTFSLSLMGENWRDYIIVVKRCLAKNGLLFIGETTNWLDSNSRILISDDCL